MPIPSDIKSLFQKTPVLTDENETEYFELVDDLVSFVQPRDKWEWRLVKQLADRYWELYRLQEYPRHIIQAGRQAALRKMLTDGALEVGELVRADQRAARFYADATERKAVLSDLAKRGLNDTSISARAFEKKAPIIADCHRIKMMIQLEINSLLQSLDRYRAAQPAAEPPNKRFDRRDGKIIPLTGPDPRGVRK